MRFSSPYPNGLDGYYYSMEALSFMERGRLENSSWAPFYYLSGMVGFLCSDAMVGVKLTASMVSSLLPLGIYLVLKNRFSGGLALLGALLTWASPSLMLLSLNFLNQLMGLCSLIFFWALLLRREKGIWIYGGLVLCSFLAVLSHLTSALILLISLLLHGLDQLWRCCKTRKHRFLFLGVFTMGGAMAAILLLSQWGRFSGAFSTKPALPLLWPEMRRALPMAVWLELSIYFIVVYAALGLQIFQGKIRFYHLMVPVLFFPFWNLSTLDMGYRILLGSIPIGLIMAVSTVESFHRSGPVLSESPKRWLILGLLPLAFLSTAVYQKEKDPPYGYYQEVAQELSLPQESLIIAHRPLNHVITFHNDFHDALNYLPDFAMEEEKLWRLAYDVPLQSWELAFPEALDRGFIQVVDRRYTLIREDYWQKYLEWEEPALRDSLMNWYNPYEVRPAYVRDPWPLRRKP